MQVVAVLGVLFFIVQVAHSSCPILRDQRGQVYDLNPLRRERDWNYYSEHSNLMYGMNFCGPAKACQGSLCVSQGSKQLSSKWWNVADYPSAHFKILPDEEGVSITHQSSPTVCTSGGPITTQFRILCPRDHANPTFQVNSVSLEGCQYRVEVESIYGCGRNLAEEEELQQPAYYWWESPSTSASSSASTTPSYYWFMATESASVSESASPTPSYYWFMATESASPTPSYYWFMATESASVSVSTSQTSSVMPSVTSSVSQTSSASLSACLSPSPSPLPPQVISGVNYLGFGYSMFSSESWSNSHPYQFGTPSQYRVLAANYTYNENKRFQSNGQIHLVPDQVAASHSESSGVRSYTFRSSDNVLTRQMTSAGISLSWPQEFHILGVNVTIPLGISPYLKVLQSSLKTSNGVYAVLREDIGLYNLQLFPGENGLDPGFVSDVRAMGASPTSYQWDQFVANYGTHVQVGLDMGGFYWYGGHSSRSELTQDTECTVGLGIRIGFVNTKLDTSQLPWSGHNRNFHPSYTKSYATFKVGGDTSISVTGSSSYTQWVKSVPQLPSRVGYQLESISPYIAAVDPTIAKSFELYLMNRLQDPSLQGEPGEALAQPIYLDSYESSSGMVAGASIYHDDDDEYYSGFWYTYSSDNDKSFVTLMQPSVQSWKTRPFGTAPKSSGSQSKDAARPISLRTTSLSQYSLNCGAYPCIPGLESMGAGYDIETGAMRLPTMQWTFAQGKVYRGASGTIFAVPDQLQISTDSQSSTFSEVYTSVDAYSRNASNTNVQGWNGLIFQFGYEVQSVQQLFYKAQSVLAISERQYIQYSLGLQNNPQQLQAMTSTAFRNAIKEAPQQYDRAWYFNFILRWGTHISLSGSFGGRARLYSMVDQHWMLSNDASQMQETVGLQWKNWELGIGWGNDQGTQTYQFSSETGQWLSFYGGDSPLALTNQWSDWVQSTHYAPSKVRNYLVPISDLASDSVVQTNLNRAVSDYHATVSEPTLPPVALNMLLEVQNRESSQQLIRNYKDVYSWSHYSAGHLHETYTNLVDSVVPATVTWTLPPGYYLYPGDIHASWDFGSHDTQSYQCDPASWVMNNSDAWKPCEHGGSYPLCFQMTQTWCNALYY